MEFDTIALRTSLSQAAICYAQVSRMATAAAGTLPY